jgi:hypothetical protein
VSLRIRISRNQNFALFRGFEQGQLTGTAPLSPVLPLASFAALMGGFAPAVLEFGAAVRRRLSENVRAFAECDSHCGGSYGEVVFRRTLLSRRVISLMCAFK